MKKKQYKVAVKTVEATASTKDLITEMYIMKQRLKIAACSIFFLAFFTGCSVDSLEHSKLLKKGQKEKVDVLLVKHGPEQWKAVDEILKDHSYDLVLLEGIEYGEPAKGAITFQGLTEGLESSYSFPNDAITFGFDDLNFMKRKAQEFQTVTSFKTNDINANLEKIAFYQSDYMGIRYRNGLLMDALKEHRESKVLVIVGVLHYFSYKIDFHKGLVISRNVQETDYQYDLVEYLEDQGATIFITKYAMRFLE